MLFQIPRPRLDPQRKVRAGSPEMVEFTSGGSGVVDDDGPMIRVVDCVLDGVWLVEGRTMEWLYCSISSRVTARHGRRSGELHMWTVRLISCKLGETEYMRRCARSRGGRQ
jgi:hypothetical protein